jgi:DNA-binding NtrC family response regulator
MRLQHGSHDTIDADVRLQNALVGCSPGIVELRGQVRQAAAFDATVLLTGETGVGKELAATWIHALSARAGQPFVSIHCAGVVETLLESELFGHRRGSFTDAHRDRRGKLALADGGTVFFDEIGEMPLRMQGSLLRFLENGEVQRVGVESAVQHLDVRVLAATNRNLEELVARGVFREDLYYRLNVVRINIPPLRQRREDIPLLLERFRATWREDGGEVPLLPAQTLARLQALDWPGNVRELETAARRLALSGWRDLGSLPVPRRPAPAPIAPWPAMLAERRRTRGDELYEELTQRRRSFWTTVYPQFMQREITRQDLRAVVKRGLVAARGNYRSVARLFNIPPDDYKKFLDFLRKHDCRLPYREFR